VAVGRGAEGKVAVAKRRQFGRVFKKRGNWAIRYRHDGHEVQKTIGPDRKTAVQALAAVETALAREEHLGIRSVAKATFAEVWQKVKAARASRLCPRAFDGEADSIARACAFFGTRSVSELRPDDIEDFLTSLSAKGLKAGTVNRYHNSLSSVLTEATSRGFARENVAARVKRRREELKEVPYIGDADIEKLIATAPPGLRPLIAILADTALRRGELLNLAWRDVDLGRGTALVRRGKNGKGREVPLTRRAAAAFALLRSERGVIPLVGDDLVFAPLLALQRPPVRKKGPDSKFNPRVRAENRLSAQFRRVAKKAGFPSLSLHGLRHSCASRMVAKGVPLSFVAKVTGHSTLTCAARYGRHAPEDAARHAIRLLEGAEPGIAESKPDPVPGTPGAAREEPPSQAVSGA
jgi:integrase